MTNSPKVLPWIARKAGISDTRADALWRKAVNHAAGHTADADFYRAAVDHLHQLVAHEKAIGM
ncbi:MAG: hypothetical protein V7642_5474 [Burkholderiales bacterium]|jgi:hypothetical protein